MIVSRPKSAVLGLRLSVSEFGEEFSLFLGVVSVNRSAPPRVGCPRGRSHAVLVSEPASTSGVEA